MNTIKCKNSFKYLGDILSSNETSKRDLQDRRVIQQLNSLLWNDKFNRKTKTFIYHTINEIMRYTRIVPKHEKGIKKIRLN